MNSPWIRCQFRRFRSWRAGLVLAVAVPAAVCGCSPHPVAAPSASHTGSAASAAPTTSPDTGKNQGPGDYLALGDSIAFGYRPIQVTQPSAYLKPANFTGYPNDVARALRLHLANASCPGETTASMINPHAANNGCEAGPHGGSGYRDFAPLHVPYSGSQLSYAVRYLDQHPGTKLVTINIGANDLFVCEQTTADMCRGADFGKALTAIGKHLHTILSALRGNGHYRGEMVVLTYYALNYRDRLAAIGTQALNSVLASSARRYGARVANGFAAFEAASAGANGDTCAAGLRIKLPSGGCDLHPTARGHRVLAIAIEKVIGHHVAASS